MKNRKILKVAIFILLFSGLYFIALKTGIVAKITDPLTHRKLKIMAEENFLSASLIYSTVTVLSCVFLALPGVTFAVVAAYLFGPFKGTVICLLAVTIGACASFLAGRYFLKDSVKPLLNKSKALRNLLFTDNKNNFFLMLMITRLVPLFPYNIQNFAYGITDVSFLEYSVLTFIFLIPGVSAFTLLTHGLSGGENGFLYILSSVLLLVVVVALSTVIKNNYLKEES